MAQVGKSARLYQDRRQAEFPGTSRGPKPQVYLPDNPVHHITLTAPAPAPRPVEIDCVTDKPLVNTSNLTEAWPNGDANAP